MGHTVFGTAELCAHIIGFLRESKDLQSCALTCQAFTFPAQTRIFYEIDVPFLRSTNLSSTAEDTISRLRRILDQAPHLRSLVRAVIAPFNSTILTNIHHMCLSRLNRLELISLSEDLLALPSLHTLVIDASFPDRGALDILFTRCTPALRRLDLRFVKCASPLDVNPTSPRTDLRPRPQIKELSLLHTPGKTATWLLKSDCPLDLSLLHTSPRLAQVLQSASPSVEELRAHTQDITDGLSLTHFTALTHLRLVGDPPSLSSALASLPSQLDRLKVLCVASRAFQSYADDGPGTAIVQKDLAGIDSAVAAVHSPALIRFQLSVLLPEGLPAVDQYASVTDSQLAVTKTRTALVRAFPLMHSRGVLAVRDYRGCA
ncbi:hypothetical protein B0H14DRAFT_2676312 [Mycena olivaceomarginata]|nr:hypothetical protein B0H14DRAFT_2676312 [Mycena olivaceomarginata]